MIGKTIDGYKIDSFEGRGGFGEVYKASKDGNTYAIKFIKTDFIYPTERERLAREVIALKKVKSDKAVQYIGEGEYTENYTTYKYVVMEYVEGKTLRDVLNDHKGPLDEKEAVSLIKNILAGLSDIHKEKIIHRDLKPENIKVLSTGNIKLFDYGLAKLIDYSSITQTGARVGTYFYMSPEQIKGEKPIKFGSDFYSIGVILYELVTGKVLFYPSSDAQIIYKTINVKPPLPSTENPKLSNKLENIIMKLLDKEVFKRYKDIGEIITDLDKKVIHPQFKEGEKLKFYPRFIQNDTSVATEFLKKKEIDGANFPINLHKGYSTITNALKSRANTIDFFADPGTNRMAFTNFRKTKGLRELNYAPDGYDPYEPESFDSLEEIKAFVEKVVDLQISNGCSMITAPYFFFENTKDDWFQLNLKLLRETADYVRGKYPQYPVVGTICTSAETISRKTERSTVIEDFGHCDMDFCEFYIDKINETIIDAQLYNLIQTGLSIKNFNGTKIMACRVPPIALGLLTIGFDAITSGLAVLDSFSKGVIVKEEDDVTMPTKFYFPDLLLSVPFKNQAGIREDIIAQEAELKSKFPNIDFSLGCNCEGCTNGKMSDNFQKPRLHFLYMRDNEMVELNNTPAKNRKKYFTDRIDKAYTLQNGLKSLGVKLKSPDYLLTWKEILSKF